MRRVRLRAKNADRWYCVRTKPGQQFFAKQRLEAQSFSTFLPLRMITHPKKPPEFVPLFGSYLFVKFNLVIDRWQAIWSTPGVSSLLSSSPTSPSSIDDKVIDSLIGQSLDRDKFQEIDPGTLVRVVRGPFADRTGFCSISTQDRVALLFKIMNRDVECYFSKADVEVVS